MSKSGRGGNVVPPGFINTQSLHGASLAKTFSNGRNYDETELAKMINSCGNLSDPRRNAVVSLLTATSAFLNATALEDIFIEMRRDKSSDESMMIFSDIQSAITTAELNGCVREAITYAKKCIKKRIEELANENDPLFKIYNEHAHDLKQQLLARHLKLG